MLSHSKEYFKDLFNNHLCRYGTAEYLRDQRRSEIIGQIFRTSVVDEIEKIKSLVTGARDDRQLSKRSNDLRITITNHELVSFAGSELWTLDAANWLSRIGFKVLVYSPKLGAVADAANQNQFAITSSITDVLKFNPDVVHIHHFEIVRPLLVCLDKRCKLVNMIHGLLPRQCMPGYSSVDSYCAVSIIARAKVHALTGVAFKEIRQIPNFFDDTRFVDCHNSAKRRRALLHSSKASLVHRAKLETAVQALGMQLDHTGYFGGKPTATPEDILPGYDLVFAVGRSAIEALASGCRVILWDAGVIGPAVTSENFWTCMLANFALTAQLLPYAFIDDTDVPNWLSQQMDLATDDCANLTTMTRTHLSISNIGPLLLKLYDPHITNS